MGPVEPEWIRVGPCGTARDLPLEPAHDEELVVGRHGADGGLVQAGGQEEDVLDHEVGHHYQKQRRRLRAPRGGHRAVEAGSRADKEGGGGKTKVGPREGGKKLAKWPSGLLTAAAAGGGWQEQLYGGRRTWDWHRAGMGRA